jgi:hypothetical protein
MYRREAALLAAAVVVRILVAIEPLMFREVIAREVIAHLFRQEHSRYEVVLASKQNLRAEAERIKPHLIVANEVLPELKERGFWVEMPTSDVPVATIGANGYSSTIHDVSLQDLLAVVDRADEELAQNVA